MSWHCSQALAVGFLQAGFSVGELSAPSRQTGTDGASSWPVRTMAASILSQSGTTCGPSTVSPGEDALTWYLEGFRARPIQARLEAGTRRTTSGRKCGESWQRSLPGTYLPRTSPGEPSMQRPTTSKRWVTRPAALPFPRRTWVVTTFGAGTGYLHTPTATANYACASMQKWKNCREFVRVLGKPTPENHEWLMTWPRGWTALQPLGTDRWRSWRQRLGG